MPRRLSAKRSEPAHDKQALLRHFSVYSQQHAPLHRSIRSSDAAEAFYDIAHASEIVYQSSQAVGALNQPGHLF